MFLFVYRALSSTTTLVQPCIFKTKITRQNFYQSNVETGFNAQVKRLIWFAETGYRLSKYLWSLASK